MSFHRKIAIALAAAALPAAAPGGPLRDRAVELLGGDATVVFAVRTVGRDGHWYANFGHHVHDADRMMYGRPGGALMRLDLRTGEARPILADAKGSFRDPHVHYDGGKILFSYRKGGSRHFHLYEIAPDGGDLRQITDGAFDDIEAIYLPDGDILFCSSRCNRWVNCWFTQVAIMYRCGADGEDIRPISANIEQDNTPWMLPDGRVLYMRWEYVDRSRVQFHHLWTANPDGTGVMVYFGNMHPGTVMLDAKPLPSGEAVVSIFSPGHGRKEHAGHLALVRPDAGPDERKWVRYIDRGRGDYRDPYPLADDLFLVAERERLLLIDADGNRETIHEVSGRETWAHEPRPLRARPREPVIADRVDRGRPTGRMILADVTHGRRMEGVASGEIEKLLVLETLPKPVNFSGTMEPISLGGTFTLPRILGTVPVEPDGSAYMEVPALRPLFLVALDANDMAVKRMQSFVTVMPGETNSCSGCHEHRTDTARFKDLLATRKPPAPIEPIPGQPDVFDFPRDIQPILDEHCVRCHNLEKPPPAGLPLVGDRGPWYSHSYAALMSRRMVSHGRDARGNKAPREIGSSASKLLKVLRDGHKKVRLTDTELDRVRLWIESGAPYPGTYAALGSGMTHFRPDKNLLRRRCASCHHHKPGKRSRDAARFGVHADLLANLTRPERSVLLLAPLDRDAGGWGLCAKKKRVFRSDEDKDYRTLLKDIRAAADRLAKHKRFDMPGFRPNRHYVREMKRYGILPESLDASKTPIDVYETDEAYWRSFWYTPAGR